MIYDVYTSEINSKWMWDIGNENFCLIDELIIKMKTSLLDLHWKLSDNQKSSVTKMVVPLYIAGLLGMSFNLLAGWFQKFHSNIFDGRLIVFSAVIMLHAVERWQWRWCIMQGCLHPLQHPTACIRSLVVMDMLTLAILIIMIIGNRSRPVNHNYFL